jgi:predicted Ser/Thr protein kinase
VVEHENRPGPLPATSVAAAGDELLWESERTRIYRRTVAGRSVILKHGRGAGAASRVRHEQSMLERLASVSGVPALAEVSEADWIATPAQGTSRRTARGLDRRDVGAAHCCR